MADKPRFRLTSKGWLYISNPSELHDLRGLPGLNIADCTVGPFRSLPAAYDGVRYRLQFAA